MHFLDEFIVTETGAVVQTVLSSTSLSLRRGHGPDCCRTKEIPQFVDTVIDVSVAQVVHFFSQGASLLFIDRVADLADMLRQVADITVVAQRSFHLILCSRPL